jgi:hypothetical protein
VLDHRWDWRNSAELPQCSAFRYVFPQFRLNAHVNEHPRSAILAFVKGALLIMMPGAMERRLRDFPRLVAVLRQLGQLRRRILSFFTEGQYRFEEGLVASNCVARLYSRGDNLLVLVTNPTDERVDAAIRIDRTVQGLPNRAGTLRACDLDGTLRDTIAIGPEAIKYATDLGPDHLGVLTFVLRSI